MDPEFVRELLPYVAKAAAARALGKSWDDIAARLEVPVELLEGLPILLPEQWERCYAIAEQEILARGKRKLPDSQKPAAPKTPPLQEETRRVEECPAGVPDASRIR